MTNESLSAQKLRRRIHQPLPGEPHMQGFPPETLVWLVIAEILQLRPHLAARPALRHAADQFQIRREILGAQPPDDPSHHLRPTRHATPQKLLLEGFGRPTKTLAACPAKGVRLHR